MSCSLPSWVQLLFLLEIKKFCKQDDATLPVVAWCWRRFNNQHWGLSFDDCILDPDRDRPERCSDRGDQFAPANETAGLCQAHRQSQNKLRSFYAVKAAQT